MFLSQARNTPHARNRQSVARPPVLLLALIGFVLSALAAGPALAERFTLRGDKIAIYNLAGEVEVVSGSGSDVVVELTRGGKDASDLDIQTGTLDGRQTLRVIYPSNRIRYRPSGWSFGSSTTIRVRKDGRFSDGSTRNHRGDRVRIGGSGLDAHADLKISVPKGQTLAVYLAVGDMTASGTNGNLVLDGSASNISVENTAGNLSVDVGSGRVDVDGVGGSVSIDTGSGNVNVSNVAGEALIVDTGSGRVWGSGFRVDALNVDTGSGSVELSSVSASRILVDTGSGHVRLGLLSDVETLAIDTGSGGVTITVPEVLGAEVHISTGSGGVRSEVPMNVERKRRDSLHGTIGDGKGRIVIETGSGGVRLLKG